MASTKEVAVGDGQDDSSSVKPQADDLAYTTKTPEKDNLTSSENLIAEKNATTAVSDPAAKKAAEAHDDDDDDGEKVRHDTGERLVVINIDGVTLAGVKDANTKRQEETLEQHPTVGGKNETDTTVVHDESETAASQHAVVDHATTCDIPKTTEHATAVDTASVASDLATPSPDAVANATASTKDTEEPHTANNNNDDTSDVHEEAQGGADSLENLDRLVAMTDTLDETPTQDGEFVTMTGTTPHSAEALDEETAFLTDSAKKRGPGRPRGRLNKRKTPENLDGAGTPKKRGRPRKVPTDDIKDAVKATPKKRGRPRKAVVMKIGNSDDEVADEDAIKATPKKRGRPRKVAVTTTDDSEDEAVKSPPKKRGRPRKTADSSTPKRRPGRPRLTLTHVVKTSDSDSEDQVAPKRRSGRPRKARVVYTTTLSDSESDEDEDVDDDSSAMSNPVRSTATPRRRPGRPRTVGSAPPLTRRAGRKKWARVSTDPFPSPDRPNLTRALSDIGVVRNRTHNDFVTKLSNMLNDNSYEDIVSWSVQGDTFIVKDKFRFMDIVNDHYRLVGSDNYNSFMRQLSNYGFQSKPVIPPAEQGEEISSPSSKQTIQYEWYHKYFTMVGDRLADVFYKSTEIGKQRTTLATEIDAIARGNEGSATAERMMEEMGARHRHEMRALRAELREQSDVLKQQQDFLTEREEEAKKYRDDHAIKVQTMRREFEESIKNVRDYVKDLELKLSGVNKEVGKHVMGLSYA